MIRNIVKVENIKGFLHDEWIRLTKNTPNKLFNAVDYMDRQCEFNTELQRPLGWISSGQFLWKYITLEETRGYIAPGMKVLEVGSGNGASSLIWSYKGYPLIGVEIDKGLADESQRLLEKYKYLQNAPLKILNGNYLTKDSDMDIDSIVQGLIESNNMTEKEIIGKILHKAPKTDIYERNGINLKDIDIVYGYLWECQLPQLYSMYKTHFRKDALMLIIAENYVEVAKKYDLHMIPRSHILSKKG
jgi:hypothetical protein